MRNRIVAVGNGDQLTEVTPYGVLLVHMWDARAKTYVARSGDWDGTDAVNVRRGLHIGNREQSDENSYTETMVENFRRQQREGYAGDERYDGRQTVDQESPYDWD